MNINFILQSIDLGFAPWLVWPNNCLETWSNSESGRRPRARVLAGGLQLVTEGYIRSRPLPPTLLLDPRYTPGRPQVESGRQIYMYLAQDVQKMFKNIVFVVFRGLRRTRLSANRVPVVSAMRAARTGLIDISWVLCT